MGCVSIVKSTAEYNVVMAGDDTIEIGIFNNDCLLDIMKAIRQELPGVPWKKIRVTRRVEGRMVVVCKTVDVPKKVLNKLKNT